MLDTESQESYAEWSWPLAVGGWVGHFGVLVPLAVAGVFVTWPQRRRLWLLHASWPSPTPPASSCSSCSRAIAIRWCRSCCCRAPPPSPAARPSGSARRRSSGRAAAAAVAAAAIVAYWPLLSPTLMRAITENNLGTALQQAGRHDEAIAHHQRAIAMMPDYAPAYNNLGASLRAAGRLDEAIAAYQQALDAQARFRQRQLQPRQRPAGEGPGRGLRRSVSQGSPVSRHGGGAQQPRYRARQPGAMPPAPSPSSARR